MSITMKTGIASNFRYPSLIKEVMIFSNLLDEEELQQYIIPVLPRSSWKVLNLENIVISDQTMELLCEKLPLSRLKVLMLNNCGITDNGIHLLSAVLPLTSLEWLGLDNNQITDEGAQNLVIAVRQTLGRVTRVDLYQKDHGIRLNTRSQLSQAVILPITKMFKLSVTLCSARTIRRLGEQSLFKTLPQELIRKILKAYGMTTT
jgi:hypothetical protein